jgi:hypothetical protein
VAPMIAMAFDFGISNTESLPVPPFSSVPNRSPAASAISPPVVGEG